MKIYYLALYIVNHEKVYKLKDCIEQDHSEKGNETLNTHNGL